MIPSRDALERKNGDSGNGVEEDKADRGAVEQVPRGGIVQEAFQGGKLGGQRQEGARRVSQEPQARLQVGSRRVSPQTQEPWKTSRCSQGRLHFHFSHDLAENPGKNLYILF